MLRILWSIVDFRSDVISFLIYYLRDASGNLQLCALQRVNVSYLYNYGAFYPHKNIYIKVLTDEEYCYIWRTS